MFWLGALIVIVGAVIVWQVPRRVIILMREAESRKQDIAELDARLARLSEMRAQARQLFETAVRRDDPALQQDAIEALIEMGAECERLLAGLHEESPILARYFQNHIAVLSHVVRAHDGKSGLSEALKAALSDLERSQAAEHSKHPLAVLERRIATGRGTS